MPDPEPELAPPSAELVLLRVTTEALIGVLGRKKAERYLRSVTEKLAAEENLSAVFALRPSSQHKQFREAHQQAAALWERYIPLFLARLPRE